MSVDAQTWASTWHRLWRALLPAPATCPECREPGPRLTAYYAAHGLVHESYTCDDCGHGWSVTT